MVAHIFKKSSFLAIALISALSLNARHHSHDIQVLINQAAPNFNYALFSLVSGLPAWTYNTLLTPRTNGGSYSLNGYIYPKGTVNPKNQSNFALDKRSISSKSKRPALKAAFCGDNGEIPPAIMSALIKFSQSVYS